MFFLKDKYVLGYKYGQPTYYGTKHLGQDYIVPTGTKLYAPKNGTIIRTFFGSEGGYTTFFKPDDEDITYRFLHLSKQLILAGSKVKEGDVFALSGNTGSETTAPHVHFDAFRGTILPPLIYTNFIDPATIKWDTMTIHKICVLLSHVLNEQTVKDAATAVKTRVEALGPIKIEFDFVQTNAVFHTIATTNENGQPLVFADPNDIAAVGHQAELDLRKQFDGVALIYDGSLVIGLPPTNPVENPVILEGFNVWSIPTNWYTNHQTGEEFVESLKQYFYHEMMHSWYYIINRENPTVGIPDKVHSFTQWWEANHAGEPGPTMEHYLIYYDSLALELKPYWPSLGNNDPIIQGEPMLIIHKKSDVNTKFALSSEMKIGFATFTAYQKHTAGRTIVDVELEDAEFAKIPTSGAVIKD